MDKPVVSIVQFEENSDSVRKAVELCDGLKSLPPDARVFIKPNIVFWTRKVPFPKWGVITTSRTVEDMVILLKEHGVKEIVIGEGMVVMPNDHETPAFAFESLGYNLLKKRYGVKVFNLHERKFREVDLEDGDTLHFNTDILDCDFVVNIPVLKTHAQTVVTLGIKNLKGTINVDSRKKCHNADPAKNLHYWVSKLADSMPPMFTLLDGIYTTSRGPSFDGRVRRTNVLVASADVFSADLAGAEILGHKPSEVPYLVHAARKRNRSLDLKEVELVGEDLEKVAFYHESTFPYSGDTLPLPMAKMGIKGLSYRKYDLTMCTYCSTLNGVVLAAIAAAWKGRPWDDVEVLTGKSMEPTPGMKKTILFGKCMYLKHKDNPNIQEMIPIKSCPPKPDAVIKAFHQAGIEIDPSIIENADAFPGFFMKKYAGKTEFEEKHFTIT